MITGTQPPEEAIGPQAVRAGYFAPSSSSGEAYKLIRARFPPRSVPDTWPVTCGSAEQILRRLNHPLLRAASKGTQGARKRGASRLLEWLEPLPGDTWQQRWLASGAQELGTRWVGELVSWLSGRGRECAPGDLQAGLLALLCADVLRPDLEWLSGIAQSRHWRVAVATHRDPLGYAAFDAETPDINSTRGRNVGLTQIATLVLAKGGGVRNITVGDCLELREVEMRNRTTGGTRRTLFYSMLRDLGIFPPDAPPSMQYLRAYAGQLSVEHLVDRHLLHCGPVRDLIVDYLRERQPALDYNSLANISRVLSLHFWKNLELHQPGIESIRLSREVASAWKERVRTKVTQQRQPDGSIAEISSPRATAIDLLTTVRAFYLDLAQWATEDPARWGQWAVPCPVTAAETSSKKRNSHRKARMDQRTRERLPGLPALVQAAHQQLHEARLRLGAFSAAGPGESFAVLGETFTKPKGSYGPSSVGRVTDAAGHRRFLGLAEKRAFWAWATVEFLRHTGARMEEMLETSHHSLTQYTLPDTGELIPLLHIAPSKTDEERLLVIDVELADVLAAIVARVRDSTGTIPLVTSWDPMRCPEPSGQRPH
jgi:hypothetical protein